MLALDHLTASAASRTPSLQFLGVLPSTSAASRLPHRESCRLTTWLPVQPLDPLSPPLPLRTEEQNAYAFCMKNSVNGEPVYLYLYALCGSCEDDERHVLWSSFLFSLTFLSQNPRWHDPLSFDLGEQHAYLNVCVWCHNIEHIDIKPDRPTPPPHRDLLLGQVRGLWKRWRRCCRNDIIA